MKEDNGPATLGELRKWLERNRRGGRKRASRALGVKSESPRREASGVGVRVEAPARFVEFSGAQLLGGTVGAVVELVDGSARLTIKTANGQPFDVAAVVAAFRGARR